MLSCKRCGSENYIKNGIVLDKQCDHCKECQSNFRKGDGRTNEKTVAKKALCILHERGVSMEKNLQSDWFFVSLRKQGTGKRLQKITFGINRCHTSASGSGVRLTVIIVSNISRRKHTRYTRVRPEWNRSDNGSLLRQVNFALQKLRVRRVSNRHENAGYRNFSVRQTRRTLELYARYPRLIVTQNLFWKRVPQNFDFRMIRRSLGNNF